MVVIAEKMDSDEELDVHEETELSESKAGYVYALFVEVIQETAVWVNCRENTIQQLLIIADSLDKVKFDVNISQTVGSSVAVVGGVTAVVGGIMSLLTLGLAAPVAIAGIAMSTAGSLTAAGAAVAEHVISKEKTKEMSEIFSKDKVSSEKLEVLSDKLSNYANNITDKYLGLNENDVLKKMIYNASKVSLNVAVNTARISEQVASACGLLTVSVGTKLFRGTNIVLGSVLIPFDVAQIAVSGHSLSKGSKSEVSVEIRKSVKALETELEEGKMGLKVMKEEFKNILYEEVQ